MNYKDAYQLVEGITTFPLLGEFFKRVPSVDMEATEVKILRTQMYGENYITKELKQNLRG